MRVHPGLRCFPRVLPASCVTRALAPVPCWWLQTGIWGASAAGNGLFFVAGGFQVTENNAVVRLRTRPGVPVLLVSVPAQWRVTRPTWMCSYCTVCCCFLEGVQRWRMAALTGCLAAFPWLCVSRSINSRWTRTRGRCWHRYLAALVSRQTWCGLVDSWSWSAAVTAPSIATRCMC